VSNSFCFLFLNNYIHLSVAPNKIKSAVFWFLEIMKYVVSVSFKESRSCFKPVRGVVRVFHIVPCAPNRLRQDSISLNEMLLRCLLLIATLVLMSSSNASGAPHVSVYPYKLCSVFTAVVSIISLLN
jgi:hypothetical protein